MPPPLASAAVVAAPRTAIPAESARARSFPWLALAVLAALCAPLFFLGMGRIALLDPDEPYYAVPALEMLRSGTWQVPLFHGHPWFDKPVLFYWIVLGAFRVLGVTELAARLGSGVAALLGVVAIFFHARRSAAGAPGPLAGLFPAIVLATSVEYAVLARFAITDMTLTLFLTLGMIAAQRFLDAHRTRWIALAGACFGLAALTKGPVGLLLPAVALTAWSAFARRADLFRPLALAAGSLSAAAVAGPWYAYMMIAHRELLMGTFLGQGNLGRFMNPEHQTSPLFYLAVLALGLLPWSGALPFALVEDTRNAIRDRAETSPLFELCWFGAILLVFSVTASRLATYILPAFPPAALLIGRYWSRRLTGDLSPRAARSRGDLAWVLPAAVGVPCGLLIALAGRTPAALEWADPWILAALGLILAAGSIGASLWARAGAARGFLAAQSATSVLVLLVVVLLAGPQVETRHSSRPLVEELRRRGLDAEVVGAVRERDFSLDFYLGRTLPRAVGRASLEAAVADHPGGIWIVPRTSLPQVASNRRLAVTLIAETPPASALRLSPAASDIGRPTPASVPPSRPRASASRGAQG